MSERVHLVGLISDTHGLMRSEALKAIRGTELIIHCGDVGDPAVLSELRSLGPVRAIRGNNDKGAWASNLPARDEVEVGGHMIYVLHNLAELDFEPASAGFTVVVSGHSHKPIVEKRGKILYVNPGSAGPRRFSLPVTVAMLALQPDRCDARIIELTVSQASRGKSRTSA